MRSARNRNVHMAATASLRVLRFAPPAQLVVHIANMPAHRIASGCLATPARDDPAQRVGSIMRKLETERPSGSQHDQDLQHEQENGGGSGHHGGHAYGSIGFS